MRIGNLKSLERRMTVKLIGSDGEECNVVVSSMPFGFEVQLAKELPDPVPPMRRMGEGKAGPIMVADREDRIFKQAEVDINHLQTTATIVAALRNDPNVVFTAQREHFPENPVAYYRAVRDELRDFGFGRSEWDAIMNAIAKLSMGFDKALKGAAESFLSAVPAAGSSAEPNSSASSG